MESLINGLATWGIGGVLMAIVVYFYWQQTQKLYAMMEAQRQDHKDEMKLSRDMTERIAKDFTDSLREVENDSKRAVESICAELKELSERVNTWEAKR